MPDDKPAKLDPERLADMIVAGCWANPGGPYAFTFNHEAVSLIVRALRDLAAWRKPTN